MAVNIAVFASGNGTNTQAIIEFFRGDPEVNVALVVASRSDAGVLNIAQEGGVECVTINKEALKDNRKVLRILDRFNIDYCILAGWLLLLPAYLVERFEGKMLNIHPALLPKFGGKGMYGHHVHEAVKAAGEQETGITIHEVNAKYDEGRIVEQIAVEVLPGDTALDIEQKVRLLELVHYPQTIKKFIQSSEK